MYQQFSPNMLKTYEKCPRKFYFQYVKRISMPVNDDIFEFGKNIHALASYYLKKENTDRLEKALSKQESEVWNYLKQSKYFSYKLINTEYNLSVKVGNNFFGGRLDALMKNGNTYYILDYKTGSIPKNAQFDFQTIIYILAVKEFFNTGSIVFVYLDLKNQKELKIEYTNDLTEKYKNRLTDTVKKINSDEFKKNKNGCICEYNKICY